MTDLPDVGATVKLVKEILSESLDLVSEKRRFRAFLQDYSRRAHTEQGLLLEGKHLKALVCGMGYPGFDEVVSGNKAAARSVGLRGLGDWLARTEGYDGVLCQWVEEVWSHALGLGGRKVNYGTKGGKPAAVVSKAKEAGHRRVEGGEQKPLRYPDRETAPKRAVEVFRDTLRDGGQGPEMVVLPTGRFRMGDLSGKGEEDERPVRTVTISRPIAMGKYPVTFEEYDRFVNGRINEKRQDFLARLKAFFQEPVYKPRDCGWGRGTRPVIDVSQEDAKAYAVWLSEQTGKRYRLPSEAEWEYAARAGTTTRYSWGDNISCSQARYGRRLDGECSDSYDGTVAVGSFAANPFGLYDMHGNVSEWVEDCWHDNYEGAPSDGSAWTTGGDESLAVLRGGSWRDAPQWVRSAFRGRLTPSGLYNDDGFRLVQDINP